MENDDGAGTQVIFHTGVTLFYHRLRFMLGLGRYLLKRRDYPLFRIFPFKSGALFAIKVIRDIGIRKIAQFGDAYFSSLTLPHYPSPAFERAVARGALNVGAAGTPLKQQIDTVLMAVTPRCDLHCQHCYERHNIGDDDGVPLERLKQILAEVQQQGVSTLVLTGGEPMNRFDDLLDLVRSADKNLSDIHVHTSGHGVTEDRAVRLKEAGLIAAAVGLDDVDPERHDELRGFRGAHHEAVSALRHFRKAGIFTYVNVCASPAMIRARDLWRYAELVKRLGVGFIQLLEPRPCGGYLQPREGVLLSKDERRQLVEFFRLMNTHRNCRDYPIVHYVAFAESPEQRGCMMGGLSHLYIDSRGNVNPCVFLPVTFGNIMNNDFGTIYARMRKAIPEPLHQECPSLQLQLTLNAHAHRNGGMPVEHRAVRKEWEEMFLKEID
jgi:MoaA/NifB/PqqE/SkfB family radical SAM enzyme